MDKNSNAYTFGFSALLVVVVGLLLASAATGLKPFQARNIKIEKMQNILGSIGVEASTADAEDLFNKHIINQILITSDGELVTDADFTAFDIDIAKELQKKPENRIYPLFQAEVNGEKFFIVPMRGKGLWGPIWGYIALNANQNVRQIYGAKFDHKSETPGLGAEINTTAFQQQYVSKFIFDADGNYVPVQAVKGGVSIEDMHKVDAISGGTITSNGVNEMIARTLKVFLPFFKAYEKQNIQSVPADELEDPELNSPDMSEGISSEAAAESESEGLKQNNNN
jgi:Na+-transporting NADH:ubiquinone oxidoreductase subunit C